MSDDRVPSLTEAIELFNRQEFYACHDALEAIWNDSIEPEKNFYQGILQIGVGLYHLSNHNWRGAAILLGEGIGRLRFYQPTHENIDVAKLIGESAVILQKVQQSGAEGIADLATELTRDGSKLPKISLNSQLEQLEA